MVERNKTFQVVVHGIMVLLCLVCVLPFLLLIMSSVADENWLIMNGYSFFPAKLSADAYQYLLVDSSSIVRGYLISAFVTAVSYTHLDVYKRQTLGRIGITESLKLHIVPDAAKLLRKRDSLHTVSKNKTQIS